MLNIIRETGLPNPPKGFAYNEFGEIEEIKMGDRFYSQQLAATGKSPGSKTSKPEKVKAPTKAQLIADFGVDISALTKADLEAVLAAEPKPVEMPTGRLKAPFIADCKNAYCDADFAKLTVAIMRELIEKANKV